MNCKYLKQKLNKKLYCKKLNKEIKISNCSNCIYKEYHFGEVSQMVKKRKKLTKLERNRTSILTDDLDHCYNCKIKKGMTLNIKISIFLKSLI